MLFFAERLGYPCGQFVTGPGTRTHKSYKVAADLNGGDYHPRKYHLSKFLTDNLPHDGEGTIKPHFEIPFEENGDDGTGHVALHKTLGSTGMQHMASMLSKISASR